MKGVIEVVSQEDYDLWIAKQNPYYFAAFPDKDPAAAKPVAKPAADTSKTAKPVEVKSVAKI
jgi:cytochrome c oxidase subunit 2